MALVFIPADAPLFDYAYGFVLAFNYARPVDVDVFVLVG